MEFVPRHLDSIRRGVVSREYGRRVTEVWERSTGVAVEHAVGALELLLVLFVFCGLGASFLTNIVGIVYPAIMSIRAIETDGKDDDTEWLIYWIVYASFSMLEYFVDHVIYWIPFFYPLKIVFLIWCFSPDTKGANILYVAMVPFFRTPPPKYQAEESDDWRPVHSDSSVRKSAAH